MSHRLQVLIQQRLASRLEKAAQRARVTRSEWVRRAIERALAEEQRTSDPLGALASLEAPTANIEDMLTPTAAGTTIEELAALLRNATHLSKTEIEDFAADIEAGRSSLNAEAPRDPWES